MIKDAEDLLDLFLLKAVVESRGCVEQNQRGAVNCTTDDVPHSAAKHSDRDQQSEAGNAQYQSNTMSDAIGQFFQTLQLAHNFSPARLDTSLIWHVSLRQILTVTGVMEPSRKSNALAVSLDSGD